MIELKDDDWICLHCWRVGSATQWKEWGVHVDEDCSCSVCDSLCYQAGDLGITLAKVGLELIVKGGGDVLAAMAAIPEEDLELCIEEEDGPVKSGAFDVTEAIGRALDAEVARRKK